MAYSFTEEQRRAIDVRDRTLLVSAAAGSGKTATLTERIIASLSDHENPTSLSRLVIATFTNDAAADMRKKIARALDAALLADPENERLRREQLLLPSAEISTISSFCLRLLRKNAASAGLSPSFRIADPAEDRLLSTSVMEELIDAVYDGEFARVSPREIAYLSEHLTSPRSDEGLSALLLSLFEAVQHEPEGVSGLLLASQRLRADAEKPLFKTAFGDEIAARYEEILSSLAAAMEGEAALLPPENERGSFILSEALYLRKLSSLLSLRDEEGLIAALAPLSELPRKGAKESPSLTPLHKEAREALSTLLSTYLTHRGEALSALLRKNAELVEILYRLLSLFELRLGEEKRRRNILGFLDIERAAAALLLENGKPTELARKIAGELDGIYLDEFQDVNALQYAIFSAIAREDNLFMVGDVKQCIYAFRHSDPHIFEALRKGMPPLGGGQGASTLFFRRNFRSDRPIVSYVNRVAGSLLFGLGSYVRSEDDLVFSKPSPVGEEPVFTHIFTLPTKKRGRTDEEAAEDAARAEAALLAEPAFVAGEVARLLREGRKNDGSPIRPSDIVLLFRNTSKMPRYIEALKRVAPVRVSEEGSLFDSPEVLLALSLLYTVDNPRRDIYLAAALRSPVFAFTPSDLVSIRSEARTAPSLYDALLAYLDLHPDFEKGKRFLKTLSTWRERAEGEPVGDLFLGVMTDAGLLSLGGRGATAGHDCLLRFYEYARSFLGAPYRGLSGFMSFIGSVIENRTPIPRPAAGGAADTVTLMSVHASKGLEAPVVFLCDTSHHFNRKDIIPPMLYDRKYGPVLRLLRADGAALETPLRSLVARRIRDEQTEEEARLLYVALTRARERLYVTGSIAKPEEKILEAERLFPLYKQRWYLLKESSALSWILPTLALYRDPYLTVHPLQEASPPEQGSSLTGEAQEAADTAEAERLADLLLERISFSYPERAMTELPEKLSVSHLSPAVLDGADGEDGRTVLGKFRPRTPRLLLGVSEDEAALCGTATHLFLQFADFGALREGTAKEELARLVSKEFLSQEDAERVRLDEIEAFCRSPLFSRILAARRVRRELRFHALLPADAFTREKALSERLSGRELLVQGVIDCVIEEEGGYTVVDYKTDRLTSAELGDRRLAAAALTARHKEQLSYYAAACRRMYGAPAREVLIYSLALGDTVRVAIPEEERI